MFARLAQMLGVRDDQVEDALRSEKRARSQLSRRGLLALGAASVTTAILLERAWSFAAPKAAYLPPAVYDLHVTAGGQLVYDATGYREDLSHGVRLVARGTRLSLRPGEALVPREAVAATRGAPWGSALRFRLEQELLPDPPEQAAGARH